MKTIGVISANYVSGDFNELVDKRTLASIPFGGRYRLIDFILSSMVNAGIGTVGIITPYNSGSLIDHIGEGTPWKLGRKVGGLFLMPGTVFGLNLNGSRFPIKDVIENRAILEKDNADYVLVTGSSSVINIDFNEMIKKHHESRNTITMAYKKVTDPSKFKGYFLNTDERGDVTGISKNATGMANYFIDAFIIDRKYFIDIINWFGKLEHMDTIDIFAQNLDRINIGTYEFKGYLGHISSVNDYMRVSAEMLSGKVAKEIFNPDRPIYTKAQDESPAFFKSGSNVKNSIIGAGCIVEGTVENSVIFRSCKIAKGATVKNSVVMMHANIDEGAEIENVVCDKYSKISAGVKIKGGENAPIIVGKNQCI